MDLEKSELLNKYRSGQEIGLGLILKSVQVRLSQIL